MQLKYDLTVGALYIKLSDAKIARTVEAGDNAAVDLDAAGGVVGIEVISAAHPWPLAEILARYAIPAGEVAQVTNYFGQSGISSGRQEAPKIGIASPAPAKPLVPA
jgi:uncharacterized protein YuzE